MELIHTNPESQGLPRSLSSRRLRFARQRGDSRIAFSSATSDVARSEALRCDELFAHFCSVAAEFRPVTIVTPFGSVRAVIDYPDIDQMVLPVRVLDGEPGVDLHAGAKVILVTIVDQAEFRFSVTVSDCRSDRAFSVSFPRPFGVGGARLTRRHSTSGTWRFLPRTGSGWAGIGPLEVRDLSCGGVGLILPNTAAMCRSEGRTLSGVLVDQAGNRILVRLVVCNLRDLDADQPGVLAGCVFRNIGYNNQAALAAILGSRENSAVAA